MHCPLRFRCANWQRVATLSKVPGGRTRNNRSASKAVKPFHVNADRTILRQHCVNLSTRGEVLRQTRHTKFECGMPDRRHRGCAGHCPGIPLEHKRIFERFYRVDNHALARNGGTGLGLLDLEWALKQHRGTVEVDCGHGSGLLFECLPKQIGSQTQRSAPRRRGATDEGGGVIHEVFRLIRFFFSWGIVAGIARPNPAESRDLNGTVQTQCE